MLKEKYTSPNAIINRWAQQFEGLLNVDIQMYEMKEEIAEVHTVQPEVKAFIVNSKGRVRIMRLKTSRLAITVNLQHRTLMGNFELPKLKQSLLFFRKNQQIELKNRVI